MEHFKLVKWSVTNLPLKLAIRPVPISADGGGNITANTALWKEVQ